MKRGKVDGAYVHEQRWFSRPPMFPAELSLDDEYEEWPRQLDLWYRCTDSPPEKRAAAVTQQLSGRARTIALRIPPDELCESSGTKKILAASEKDLLRGTNAILLNTFSTWESLAKKNRESARDFIRRFTEVAHQMERKQIPLRDTIKAFYLLSKLHLSEAETEIVISR